RHGDIHEHDVRMRAVELADGSQAVAGLGCHLPAEGFDHANEVLTGKYGVVHDQIADRLSVLAAFYWCKLLHNPFPLSNCISRWLADGHITSVMNFACNQPPRAGLLIPGAYGPGINF